MTNSHQDDAQLAAKIVDAMKEVDAADSVRKEKAIIAGKLLAEAQQRHPSKEAFEIFLKLAGDIQYRRAVDLIGFALGRKDFEQHQAENAAAAQRHRDKLKSEKIEREKAKATLPKPEPKLKGKGKPEPAEPKPGALRNAQTSAASLREFETICLTCLPKLNISDLEKADKFFRNLLAQWRHSATNKKVA
jgi:hypothetical protein